MNTTTMIKGRILFIEDSAALAELYSSECRRQGYQVLVAGDGRMGLRLVAEVPPDLILLDLRLPGMDGFSVLETLRTTASTSDIPVVIFSNETGPEAIERARALGAIDYLVKSETVPSVLLGALGRWLRTPATARSASQRAFWRRERDSNPRRLAP